MEQELSFAHRQSLSCWAHIIKYLWDLAASHWSVFWKGITLGFMGKQAADLSHQSSDNGCPRWMVRAHPVSGIDIMQQQASSQYNITDCIL